jgi:hypothetical protein
MSYTGVNQSSSLEATLSSVKYHLEQGHNVQVTIRNFGSATREHDPIEYEVYVDL